MNKKIDNMISDIVKSVEHKIPETIETQLIHKIKKVKHKKGSARKKYLLWYPVTAMATILVGILLLRPFQRAQINTESPITEIRTEFEIKDKNIKIIWFQKKDFKLRRKNK